MTMLIEIEGGLVRKVERTVHAQVPLEDYLPTIERREPINTPTLPVGTRAMLWDPTDLSRQKFGVLIELPPHTINMNYIGERHELSIPYTRFFFYLNTSNPDANMEWSMNDYRVFWAKEQYNEPSKRDMIAALLPNVYDDGRICFGSTAADAGQTLAQRLNQTVNEFYVSEFNDDLTIRRPAGWRGWRQWERMTQNDPTGWMEWDDLNPAMGIRSTFSYDDLMAANAATTARFELMVAADPIPAVPIEGSIGAFQELLDSNQMTNTARDRLLQTMLRDRALHNDRYEPVAEEEEMEAANA